MASKKWGQLFCTASASSMESSSPAASASTARLITTRWSLWPWSGAAGGVEPVCTAVDGDGAALALEDTAAGPQFGFHGCNAVALLDTETFRVADGGGPFAKQAQDHQHGAEVGAVGKVNVHTVERCFLEHDACVGGAEACTTAAQNVEDRGIALPGCRRIIL